MQSDQEVVYLYLDDIIPNRFQPREVFDERPLKELAVSIKEHGVIQPIIVRKANDKYEIIAGERRYKASALAGLTKIPAIVRDLDDKESSKVALLENLQRKNLNPLEEAKTYQKILEIDEMTQEELAKTMGKSQSAVANKLRLLSLPEEVQQALLKEQISERHARTLLNINDQHMQIEMLNEIVTNKMTVRQLESKIKELKQPSMNEIKDTVNINQPEIQTPENSKSIAGNQNFISNNPLIPTIEGMDNPLNNQEPNIIPTFIQNEDNNNEEQKEEESTDKQPKFINFGEINDDTSEEETVETKDDNISFGNASATSQINLDELKENTNDISLGNSSSSGVDLDSLLRINSSAPNNNPNVSNNNQDNNFKFFSPAEEALKNSELKEDEKTSEDYFKAPDLINIDLPGQETTFNTNNVPLSSSMNDNINSNFNNQGIDNLKDSIEIIRNAMNQIEAKGIKIEKDEISLENSYQIVIKLQK